MTEYEVYQPVRRARNGVNSKQPRFADDTKTNQMFSAIMRHVKTVDEAPSYQPDSRARDEWLRGFWPQETNLAGVINGVVAIDKNRGWQLVGGRNQVRYYSDLLRFAENGRGWRYYASLSSLSFWTADINSISETEREGVPGRLTGLYYVDPARCFLQGGSQNSLRYYPPDGSKFQTWHEIEMVRNNQGVTMQTPADYFRVASLPSTDERYNGLGFCALSRAIEIARILVAVYEYDKEKLGARAPQGLLLLHNVSEDQWDEAMRSRNAELDGLQRDWFGGVAVLASAGVDQNDAKLVALSQLPDNFKRGEFVQTIMYGYALCFGYDATEFWPVNAGVMGRGRETEIQHRKATGKGGLDFALSFQDQIQAQLPDTIQYSYEQRDVEGELMDARVTKMYVDMVSEMYMAGLNHNEGMITRDQALSILARHTNIVPKAWTEIEEETVAKDTEHSRLRVLREMYRKTPQVIRAAEVYPSEPIIQHSWPVNEEIVLWQRGDDIFKPLNYRGFSSLRDISITRDDVLKAIGPN